MAGMDNTVELQALRQSVSQLSGDVANLVFQRNVAQLEAAKAQQQLAELTAERDKLKAQVDQLQDDLAFEKGELDDLGRALDKSEYDVDRATRYMTAENALAFTTGGDPVPADSSGR